MAERTHIQWTDHTFNPWLGCQKVSPGCDNCYAETLSHRFGQVTWGPGQTRRPTSVATWRQPRIWNRRAQREGRQRLVFTASLADIFDNQAPSHLRAELWLLIRETPHLTWQILTKRPENMRTMLPVGWGQGYRNVWLGVSAENQAQYDHRWSILAATPAALRFISYEPALGPLDISGRQPKPDWLIWGSESGPKARPLDPQWIRSITEQCQELRIPVFGKQWGQYANNPLVCEQDLTPRAAAELDPRSNGKGGALLHQGHSIIQAQGTIFAGSHPLSPSARPSTG